MQAIKEKIQDMKAVHQAKTEARAVEKAEKELAKTRVAIAKEVRMAREAEAEMDYHVTKAGERAEREIAKHEAAAANKQQNDPNTDDVNPPTASGKIFTTPLSH